IGHAGITKPTPSNTSAAPGTVQSELNTALANVGVADNPVSVSRSGNIYTVTFGGVMAGTDLNPMGTPTTGGASATVTTTKEGTGTTTVSSGATLQLQGGITFGAERVTINGTGFNNAGALDNFSGNN